MPSFALISEGITDQVVIESILDSFYKGEVDDLSVAYIQPTRDATDVSRQDREDFGGWEQVLEHCSIAEHMYEALALNDYIIIQIDSDICWHPAIKIDPGLQWNELVEAIQNLILSRIDPAIIASHQEQLIFAIAIHSTECWLIPLYTKVLGELNRVNDCEGLLGCIIRRNNGVFKKEYRIFKDLVRPLRKKKNLLAALSSSPSLNNFVSKLPVVKDESA
ncbi:hypothetical protein [uncultured Pseudomonas sp.]|uniref:hypothetical protein n=1 Tax=uncultured Pseudomonas sp. TaxID=114707 RepID=UPI0025E48AA8|nr:hypothetical protein [uncultured Pseudomonas sp.]